MSITMDVLQPSLVLLLSILVLSNHGVAGCDNCTHSGVFAVISSSPKPSPKPSPILRSPSPALPLLKPQCEWPEGGWPPECRPSHAALLAAGAPWVNGSAYGARATAFLVAASLHCKQFKQATCKWPCMYNGETCAVYSALAYNVWDCPGSKADMRIQCNLPVHSSSSLCKKAQGCKWCTGGEYGSGSCEAAFFANMTDSGRLFWVSQYFSQMPKEQIGCCKGSNYRWAREQACRVEAVGPLARAECRKRTGCEWSVSQGLCLPGDAYLISLMFANDPTHPLVTTLTNMAKECRRVTNATTCSNYKPVVIDRIKMGFYLDQDLKFYNTKVTADQCKLKPGSRDIVQYDSVPQLELPVDAGPPIGSKPGQDPKPHVGGQGGSSRPGQLGGGGKNRPQPGK